MSSKSAYLNNDSPQPTLTFPPAHIHNTRVACQDIGRLGPVLRARTNRQAGERHHHRSDLRPADFACRGNVPAFQREPAGISVRGDRYTDCLHFTLWHGHVKLDQSDETRAFRRFCGVLRGAGRVHKQFQYPGGGSFGTD